MRDRQRTASSKQLQRRTPPWTTNSIVLLNDDDVRRADILANGWRQKQQAATGANRDERANIGEAATIVAALKPGYAVLLDDGKPKRYAMKKGLTVVTTEDIAVELAAAKAIAVRRAFTIYQRVYGSDRTAFDAAVNVTAAALEAHTPATARPATA